METKRRGRPRKSDAEKKANKAAYMKKYHAAHKEEYDAYNHAYYRTHREEILDKRKNNPHLAEYQREWRSRNRDKWNAYIREYRLRKKLDKNNEE